MWNAKITKLQEGVKPEDEELVAETKGLQIRELESWLNLQVPSLNFAKLRAATIKAKGLDAHLDETYHVFAVKQGEQPTLTTQEVNTFVSDEDELLAAEEAEEAEELSQPNVTATLGIDLGKLTADQAIKQIGLVNNPNQLEALKADERTNKNRSTVVNAITERLEDLQTQP